MFDCSSLIDFCAKVVYFHYTYDGAVEFPSVLTGLFRGTSRTLWSTTCRIRIFPNSPDQRESFLPDEISGGTFAGARMCVHVILVPGKPRDITVTNPDTVFRERFPAGLSLVIRIGYSRQFRNGLREKFWKEKPGKPVKRFPVSFPMETVRLYSGYVRTRQARRKRGEKRKSVSGIKTGKFPGKFPGNLTNIIPVRIPLRSPYASRVASSSDGRSFINPFPSLV